MSVVSLSSSRHNERCLDVIFYATCKTPVTWIESSLAATAELPYVKIAAAVGFEATIATKAICDAWTLLEPIWRSFDGGHLTHLII